MEGGEEEGKERLLPAECKEPWPLKLSKESLVNILSKPFLRPMTFGRVLQPDSHCQCLLSNCPPGPICIGNFSGKSSIRVIPDLVTCPECLLSCWACPEQGWTWLGSFETE